MKNIRDGYKMTELGEIPDEWKVEKLKDVAKVIDSLHETPIYSEDGFPMIRVVDVNGKAINVSNANKVSEEVYNKFTRKYKPKLGDIIMSRVGSYGLVSYLKTNDKICLGQNIVIITTDYCKKYLFYALNSNYIKSNIDRVTVGSSQKTLSLANINEFKLMLPTIKEQEKIASILSTVDEQIDNVDALIEKNKELKKGLMQTLLTKGIGHTKFKTTEIGEIPEEWEVVKFKEITDILRCGVASTPTYVENGIPFLSAQNVNNEKLSLHKYNFISEDYHKQLTKNDKPQKGDILYSRVGANYGIAAVVDIDFEFSVYVSLTLIRMKNEYDSKFYKYLLNSTVIRKQADIGVFQGGGVPNLNVKVVEKFNVVVPPKYEQIKIASILSEVDRKIDEYENKKQKLEELKKGLMQQLLTGMIRVTV